MLPGVVINGTGQCVHCGDTAVRKGQTIMRKYRVTTVHTRKYYRGGYYMIRCYIKGTQPAATTAS